MSYGENHYSAGLFPTVHAEDDAISKLPVLKRNKKLKKIDMLVVRVNHGGTLGNSKPCFKCISDLYKKLPKKGYILDTVYYTDRFHNVVSKKFSHLVSEGDYHVPKFFSA